MVAEFVEGLAEEFAAGLTFMDVPGFAAGPGDGGDAAVALDLRGGFIAAALGTEGGDKSGDEDIGGAGEGAEDRLIGVLAATSSQMVRFVPATTWPGDTHFHSRYVVAERTGLCPWLELHASYE